MSICAIHKDELAVKKRAVKQRIGISPGIVSLDLALDLAGEIGPFPYGIIIKKM